MSKAKSAEPTPLPKFLGRDEVMAITKYSYPSLWNKIKQGKFPPGHAMDSDKSGRGRGRVVWLESDIRAWMESRPLRWPKGSSAKARSAA